MDYQPSAPPLTASVTNENQAFNFYPHPQQHSGPHQYPPSSADSNNPPLPSPPALQPYSHQNISPPPGSPPYSPPEHSHTSHNPPPPPSSGDIESQPENPITDDSDDDDLPGPCTFYLIGILLGFTIPLVWVLIVPFLGRFGVKKMKKRFMLSGLVTALVIQLIIVLCIVTWFVVLPKVFAP